MHSYHILKFASRLMLSTLLILVLTSIAFCDISDYCKAEHQRSVLFPEEMHIDAHQCIQHQSRCASKIFASLQFLRNSEQKQRDFSDLDGLEIQQLLIIQGCAQLSRTRNNALQYCKMQQCLESFQVDGHQSGNTISTRLKTLRKVGKAQAKTETKQLQYLKKWAESQSQEHRKHAQDELKALKSKNQVTLRTLRKEQTLTRNASRQNAFFSASRRQKLQAQQQAEYQKLENKLREQEAILSKQINDKKDKNEALLKKRKDFLQKLQICR